MSDRWDVMSVREYVRGDGTNGTQWTKVGAAFDNRDGSINIQLDAVPFSGKLQLQRPLSREEREARRGGSAQTSFRGGSARQHYRPKTEPKPAVGIPDNRPADPNSEYDDEPPPF